MRHDTIDIELADSPEAFKAARDLFIEYSEQLQIDLCFQGFDAELRSIHERYGAPDGCLLLAHDEQGLCGCVGVRRFDASRCEMKRMYVRPRARGRGLGRLLGLEALRFAQRRGYEEMLLDSLPTMSAAVRLYESLGFERVSAYYDTPIVGTVFMRRRLQEEAVDV